MPELFNTDLFLTPPYLLLWALIALIGTTYLYQAVTLRAKIRKLKTSLAQDRVRLQQELDNVRILRSTKDYCVPMREAIDE